MFSSVGNKERHIRLACQGAPRDENKSNEGGEAREDWSEVKEEDIREDENIQQVWPSVFQSW